MREIYTSTFCNFGHDLKTGRPVAHECYIIPPAALAAEQRGDIEEAHRLMAAITRQVVRGRPLSKRTKVSNPDPSARPSKGEQATFRKQCLYGMAKGPWASWWANEQEEKGRSFSGQNVYDLCPEPPPAAKKWAKKIYETIAFLNTYFPEGMTMVFNKAKEEGFAGDAEEFGFRLGCQAAGMGIAWDDDLSTNFKIEVPQREFYI